MREVRNVAQVIRETVKTLRAQAAVGAQAFQDEVAKTKVNMEKLGSLTKELKAANLEVETALGESGSNFPLEVETTSSMQETSSKAGNPMPIDQNGVRPNAEAAPVEGVDVNGVRINP